MTRTAKEQIVLKIMRFKLTELYGNENSTITIGILATLAQKRHQNRF